MKLKDIVFCVECEEVYNLRKERCPSCGCSQRIVVAWYIPSKDMKDKDIESLRKKFLGLSQDDKLKKEE